MGVVEIYYLEPNAAFMQRWGGSIDKVLETLTELGIPARSITLEPLSA